MGAGFLRFEFENEKATGTMPVAFAFLISDEFRTDREAPNLLVRRRL